jgi:hypothetical protein
MERLGAFRCVRGAQCTAQPQSGVSPYCYYTTLLHDYRPWRIVTNGAFDALSGFKLQAPGLQASGLDSGKYTCSRLSEGASVDSVSTNGSGEDSFRASSEACCQPCRLLRQAQRSQYCPHYSHRARGTRSTAVWVWVWVWGKHTIIITAYNLRYVTLRALPPASFPRIPTPSHVLPMLIRLFPERRLRSFDGQRLPRASAAEGEEGAESADTHSVPRPCIISHAAWRLARRPESPTVVSAACVGNTVAMYDVTLLHDG